MVDSVVSRLPEMGPYQIRRTGVGVVFCRHAVIRRVANDDVVKTIAIDVARRTKTTQFVEIGMELKCSRSHRLVFDTSPTTTPVLGSSAGIHQAVVIIAVTGHECFVVALRLTQTLFIHHTKAVAIVVIKAAGAAGSTIVIGAAIAVIIDGR